ncbi:hypothetical protein [Streptomyces sp. NPDC020681]|uniref:hypothetical protein n=1 Tax=Streptomyces sp. NPDC020681 TaxID=3365083 RepID=UPI0037BAE4EE
MSRERGAKLESAWKRAQRAAHTLISERRPQWHPHSLEFRSAHDVLAITLMYHELPSAEGEVQSALTLLALLSHDVEWALWCRWQLVSPRPEVTPEDAYMARRAWRRLSNSTPFGGSVEGEREYSSRRGVGVAVGVFEAAALLKVPGQRPRS